MPRWLVVAIWLACLTLLGMAIYPVFAQAKQGDGRNSCRSMLVQLSTALRIYAEENDGLLPREAWLDAVVPMFPKRAYECDVVRKAGKHFGYAMNVEAAGRTLSTLPASMVVLFETDALAPNVVANLAARKVDRHPRGSYVGYADGSVRLLEKVKVP